VGFLFYRHIAAKRSQNEREKIFLDRGVDEDDPVGCSHGTPTGLSNDVARSDRC